MSAPEGGRRIESRVRAVPDDHVGFAAGFLVQHRDDGVPVPAGGVQQLEDQDDRRVTGLHAGSGLPHGGPVDRFAGQVGGADERGVDLPDRRARAAASSATSPDASSADTVKLGPARSSWVLMRFAARFGMLPTTPSAVMGGVKASRARSADAAVTGTPDSSSQWGIRQRAPARATSGSTPVPMTTMVRSRGRFTVRAASRAASSTRS